MEIVDTPLSPNEVQDVRFTPDRLSAQSCPPGESSRVHCERVEQILRF